MVTPLNVIQQAHLVLSQGGVILHPTETCYGFACDATHDGALKKLYKLKRMPFTKPCSIMVSSLEEAQKYGNFSELAKNLAREFWPGPLTLIVPRKNFPEFLNSKFLNSNSENIGIRVPAHSWTLELLRTYPSPLITTSANVSGQPETYQVSEVLRQLQNEQGQHGQQSRRPDFIVDVGIISEEKPSTILKILDDSFRILREGPLRESVLQRYLKFLLPE